MDNSKTSKSGFAPIIIIVLIAVAVIGAGLFFISKNGGSIPGLSLTPRATEKDFQFISDPLIRKHFVAQANVNAYQIKSSSSGRGDITSTNQVQISGNDVKFAVKEESSGKEFSHLISIGDTTYLKDYSDNKWWKETLKPEEKKKEDTSNKVEPSDFKAEFEKTQTFTYKSLGQEACGNLTCYKYEEVDPKTPEGKRTFWFDTQKFLLRKEISGFGEFTATNEYSYDGISIVSPSPTKDVPSGHSIYEYMSSGPNITPQAPIQTNTQPPSNPIPDQTQNATPTDMPIPVDQSY